MRIANRSIGTTWFRWLCAAAPGLLDRGPPGDGREPARTLTAETHDSGFALAHDTYNGLSSASDGRIYYVLSTEPFDVGARMFVFDPATGKIRDLGDLTEACGEKGKKAIVQGKSHVNFVECAGQALLRHARRLLLDHRRHGDDGHSSRRATSPIRAATCSPTTWRPASSRTSPSRPSRGHPVHEHGHGAGADLRPDLADRALLPLRPGHAGPEGLRPGLRPGRRASRARSIARSAGRSPSIPRRLGLLHRLGRDDPPLPARRPTRSRSSRATT